VGAYEIHGIFLVVFIYWQLFYAVKEKDTGHIVYVVAPILLMFVFIYTTLFDFIPPYLRIGIVVIVYMLLIVVGLRNTKREIREAKFRNKSDM
jgi:predicted membrane protein